MLPKFNTPVFLAPMAMITNLPFRLLCKKYGAGLTGTELISARAIINENTKTLKKIDVSKDEKPVFIQLFGDDSKILTKAAQYIENRCDIIDLNLGCPAKKIYDSGCGSALLKDPKKVEKIVSKLASSISKPLTVKIRTGIDKHSINAVQISKLCENAGAQMITIHGKTRKQKYSGEVDFETIKKVKEAVNIPVIGNGNINSGKSAKEMFTKTGCNYISVGRSALRDPLIFKRINHYLRTNKELPNPTYGEQIKMLLKYFDLCEQYNYDHIAHFRSRAQHFLYGFEGASKIRKKLNTVQSRKELEKIIQG